MLNELAKRIREDNAKRGFKWQPENPYEAATLLCLIHSEVSEALEKVRDGKNYSEELADIIIRTLDLCAMLNIDIDKAIQLKLKYNRSRPAKHGRKFF